MNLPVDYAFPTLKYFLHICGDEPCKDIAMDEIRMIFSIYVEMNLLYKLLLINV